MRPDIGSNLDDDLAGPDQLVEDPALGLAVFTVIIEGAADILVGQQVHHPAVPASLEADGCRLWRGPRFGTVHPAILAQAHRTGHAGRSSLRNRAPGAANR